MDTQPALPTRLARLAGLARARLFWEIYAPTFAVAVAALTLFAVLSMIGAWEVAGDPVRLLGLAVVIGLFVRAALRAKDQRLPTRSDALRRLERTAGLPHRPLDTIQDSAAVSPDLWPAHVAKANARADTIRRVGHTPALTPLDRYGLRFILPALLIVAVYLSFGVVGERLRRALSPSWLPMTNPNAVQLEAWVDPPDYTGRPPIYASGTDAIRAPVGSTLVVRASGAKDLPRPRLLQTIDGRRRTQFLNTTILGENALEVRAEVRGSGELDWRMGWRRDRITIEALPDDAPTITTPPAAFDELNDAGEPLAPDEHPSVDKRDRLVVHFDAADDYGIDRVVLEMVELSDDLEDDPFSGETSEFDTGAGGFKTATNRAVKLDMTRHPLAGRKVVGRLVAIDGAGQRGTSDPLYFTVPDKIFVEPLAKAIVEQRRLLMAGTADYAPMPAGEPDNDASDGSFDTYQTAWRMGRAPETVQRTARLIEAVTDLPNPRLFNDPVVYTGLRHVGKTLRYSKSQEALVGLPDHMWKLAIRAEFGVLGTALQEMQEAQEALREGIARRAPQREIDTLFARYDQAVEAYMEELRKNAKKPDESGGEGGGGQPMGSTDEIQELLDAIEEANRNGDTEGARKALAQLAELLENLEIQLSNASGGGGEGEPSDGMSEEMQQSLEDLAETLGEQRELQDETRQAEREELAREDGDEVESVSPEELARRQAEIESLVEGLRDTLDERGDRAAPGEGEDPGAGDEGEGEPGQGTEPGDEVGGAEPGEDGAGAAAGEDGDQPGGAGQSGDPRAQGGSGGDAGEGEESAGSGLSRALEAMQRSEDALEQGDLSGSRSAQSEAIRALRDAGEAMARDAEAAREDGEGSEGQGGGDDPLGRSNEGFNSDNAESDLSEQDNAERAREIEDELRRRASEAERDAQEQDYLERLLKRF